MQQLNLHNTVSSSDLSTQLDVSEDTVRRDLQELSEGGNLIKVHGGALSNSFHFTLHNNQIYSLTEKKIIAQKAATLITDGMVVLLSGGTTIRELVKALPPQLDATFITVSVPIALELMNHPRSEVIFVGNKLLKSAQVAVGAEVIQRLAEIRADICFLGVNGIDADKGITDLDWEVIEVKKAIIRASRKVVSLVISEKLNSAQKLKVCSLKDMDILITELAPENDLLDPYRTESLTIL